MLKIGSKKRFALVASTTAAVLIGSGVAVAFWTTSGSGSGSASTGTTTALTVTHTNTIANLYPGGPAVPIDIDITNADANPHTVATFDISNVVNSNAPACPNVDYVITDGSASTPNNVAASTTTSFAGTTTGASIRLAESGINQDACKGATVTFDIDVS